ncbi:MAG: hypothetical protein ACFB16_09720 [Phormidesmis sp.]
MKTRVNVSLCLAVLMALGLWQSCKAPASELIDILNAPTESDTEPSSESDSEADSESDTEPQPDNSTQPTQSDDVNSDSQPEPTTEPSATESPATELQPGSLAVDQPDLLSEIRLGSCLSELEDATEEPSQFYTVINEQEEPAYDVRTDYVLEPSTLPSRTITFDEQDMLSVVAATRAYFFRHGCQDLKVLRDGISAHQDIEVTDVLDTLDFMAQILQEDIAAGRPTRLKDPTFINQNFDVIRWMGYDPTYLSEERVRITKYAVFTHEGSRERTDTFNVPVYRLNDDLENEDFITQYTKQDVLSGIFEPGGAEFGKVEALAYLTRESFEDALMQGTAFVEFPDGSSTYFNVDRNNGIAYVAGVDPWQQGRYWYFREVTQLNGYGYDSAAKIPIEPGVTFAGDVLNIGLGKIIAIEEGDQNIRFGIVADTGGAFLPNLHQLDYFAGVFPDRASYQQAVSQIPEYTQAYLLLKKELNTEGD